MIMETLQARQQEMEAVSIDVECAKDFECYRSGFVNLCKVRKREGDAFLECLEEEGMECDFSFPCEKVCFCLCPVRIYIAKRWGK
jgi:hypothetical protein